MRLLILVSKISRKLHIQGVILAMLKPFALLFRTKCKGNVNPESILSNISPDIGTTALCKHTIPEAYEYDLHIIMPMYNSMQYIEEAVNSILQQQTQYTYLLSIVDDGSTDGSGKLIDELYLNNSHIEIFHKQNEGQAVARNFVLNRIKGRYILFADSDDVLAPGAIEKLVSTAYTHNANIVCGSFYSFVEGKILYKYNLKEITGLACGKVFEAELWRNVRFPEKYKYEDTLCAFILFHLAKKKILIQDIVFGYRKNPKSTTHISHRSPRILDLYWITKRLLIDRLQLGILNNQDTYDEFLKQVRFNADHILMLNNKNIGVALMQASNNLRQMYFDDCHPIKAEYRGIEKALKYENYLLFVLYSLFY